MSAGAVQRFWTYGQIRRQRRRAPLAVLTAAVLAVALAVPVLSSPQAAAAEPTPAALAFTVQPGDGAPGQALTAQPTVTVEDSTGAAITSSTATVTLTLTGPKGAALAGLPVALSCDQTASGTTSLAATAGAAAFTGCATGRGGLFTLTATDATDHLTAVSSEFFVSGPAQLAFLGQPGGGSGGQAWDAQPQVAVEDAHGTVVSTSAATISLAIQPGSGAAGAALACTSEPTTASQGVATFAGCAIDAAATGYRLVATDSTDQLQAVSATFTVTAGPPARLMFTTQPFAGTGGSALATQPTVAVEDAGGNVITGNSDQISLAIKSGSGTSGSTLSCDANPLVASAGSAAFTGCAIDDAGTGYRLVATDSAHSLTATSGSFDVTAGNAATITFGTGPSGGAAGETFTTQPTVTVTDAGGNGIPSPVTLAIKGSTGSAGATLTCDTNPVTAGPDGVATFAGCSIDTTGTGYELTATSGSLTVTSTPFDVTTGAVAGLAFTTQPGGATGGRDLSTAPVVSLTDAGGAPAAGSVTLSLTAGTGATGATLNCAADPATATGGSATFHGCSIDKAGTYRLTATSGTITATSAPFVVALGAPARLAFTTQPGGGTGGTPWATAPVVTIEDAGGNTVTGDSAAIALTVTQGTGDGTLTCAADSLPAVRGAAVFAGCAIDTAATAYTLTATDAHDSLATTSETFAVTPGTPSRLVFSAQPSSGPAGIAFAIQPAVTVVDAGGNTVTGTADTIDLALTAGTGADGANLSCAATGVTIASGSATFAGCAVDVAAAGYTLTATDPVAGLTADSLPFSILPPPPAPLGQAPVGVPAAQTMGGRAWSVNPTNVADDVDTATGALTFGVTDLRVAGIGEPLVLQRTYNSNDTSGGTFGPGWTSLLDADVTVEDLHTAVVRGDDGQQLIFTKTSNGNAGPWTGPPGAQASLFCTAQTCTVTRFDGEQLTVQLGPGGTNRIIADRDRDGQGLTFAWRSSSVVITVDTTNSRPYRVTATLNRAGQVTGISTPAGRTVSYGYTGGLLTSVTDGDGNTWTYGYSGGVLTSETDPLGAARLTASYGSSGRVSAIALTGSAQHADDTFTWDAATGTATTWALRDVDGSDVREPSEDSYLGNVLVAQTRPDGAVTRYSYDDQVNLTEIQDPLGWVQQFGYDGAGDLTSQTEQSAGGPATVSMTYNAAHQLLTQTDADGNTTSYSYTGPDLTSITPPGAGWSGQTTLAYNQFGELTTTAGPLSSQSFGYDAAGNRTTVLTLDLNGHPLNGKGSTESYDEAGDPISATDAVGTTTGPAGDYTTTWSYDPDGNLLATTAPGPRTTTYTYDDAGDLATATDPTGVETSYAWDETTLTDSATGPSGTSSQTYDPSGDLLSQTGPTGQGTSYTYNADGLTSSTTSADNVTVRQTYDLDGNPVLVTDTAGNVVSREFDAQGRAIRENSDGAVTLTAYDAAGNVVSTTDPDGNVSTATYTPDGQVASASTAAGTTAYGYDPAGDLTSVTDPGGNETTYGYQAPGLRTTMTVGAGTALAATTSYGYDADGRMISTTDPDGRTTAETLNAQGQPTTTVSTETGQPTITVTRAYDPLGRVLQMTDPTGSHSYTYNSAGNLLSATGPGGTFRYDFSTPGQITETYPDGTTIAYRVDDAGNLMSMSSGTAGQSDHVAAAYQRNAQGQTTAVAYSNGVLQTRQLDQAGDVLDQAIQAAGTTLGDDAFSYDADGNPLSQTDTVAGTQTTDQYGYDGDGRITSFTTSSQAIPAPQAPQSILAQPASFLMPTNSTSSDPAVTTTSPAPAVTTANPDPAVTVGAVTALQVAGPAAQIPDPAPQALSQSDQGVPAPAVMSAAPAAMSPAPATTSAATATTPAPTYEYDGAGNLTSRTTPSGSTTSSYNSLGEITSSTSPDGTTTYSYDNRGDLLTVSGPDSSQSYAYNAADQLTAVTTTGGGNVHTVTYGYDGDGNRVSATVDGQTTDYLWDPAGAYPRLAIEQTSTGALVRRYLYGDGPVAMQTPTATYFYQVDPMGNVAELTDSSGHVAVAYHYDPFGEVAEVVPGGGTAPTNPLLFQGQYQDPVTGLYDMRARNYDPATGRFTQPDPVTPTAATPATSPYVFAEDNPLSNADPTGTITRSEVRQKVLDVVWSTPNVGVNVATDLSYALTLTKGAVKLNAYLAKRAASKAASAVEEVASDVGSDAEPISEIAGDAATAEGALGELGIGANAATEAIAGTSTLSRFANVGGALQIIGIGLQTYLTVEACESASASVCAGDVVSESVSIVFFVGCTALTEGTMAAACAVTGLAMSTALQQVVTRYGPQIYNGLASAYTASAAAIAPLIPQTAQALTTAGTAIAGFATSAGGTIATGFNRSTAAIASGFDGMVSTLRGAGYTAGQLGQVLTTTFDDGADDVAATLIGAGYDIGDVAQALGADLGMTAQQAAQLLKDGYGYTATEVATALSDAYHLSDAAAAAVLQGVGFAAGETAVALKSAYRDTAAAVASALNSAKDGLDETTAALQQAFDASDQAMAGTLRALGYTASQVAESLQQLYGDADLAAATALQSAGYAVGDVTTALLGVYADGAQAAATVLNSIGYAAGDVASALDGVYSLADATTAQVLRTVGYTVDQVAGALQSAYDDADAAAAEAMAGAGYAAAQVAGALDTVYSDGDKAAASALQAAGYGINQVTSALSSVFDDTDTAAAKALAGAHYAAAQVAGALNTVYSDGDKAAASALQAAGYGINAISGALSSMYADSAQQAAVVLKSLGYTASEVTGALTTVYNEAASGAADVLKVVGYGASDIANVLENTFDEGSSDVANLLSSIGFSNSTIQSIGGAFSSFGQSVKNCFDSFFSDC